VAVIYARNSHEMTSIEGEERTSSSVKTVEPGLGRNSNPSASAIVGSMDWEDGRSQSTDKIEYARGDDRIFREW